VERAKPPVVGAYRAFYPAAALYGALMLPASVLALTGVASGPAAVAAPPGHAREMLFGFALAVVAGNQLGALTIRRLVAVLALWGAARAAFFVAPASAAAAVLNAAFAVALALHVAPRLFRSAKKWRNRALPVVLTALCVLAAASAAGPAAGYAAVALFALLMLFMGGRMLAPAIAGQLQRQGERLDARVQPRIEAALIVACAVAVAALAGPGLGTVAAAALAAAGVLAAIRLVRWRLWAVRGRPDFVCLAAGYAWLSAGLLAFGASLAAGRHQGAALHLITVGALGTLTFNVMAMSWLRQLRRPPERSRAIVSGTALLAAATVLRVLGGFHAGPWLVLAAACWSAAYLVLLVLFLRARPG
jgi:uncharacterized protein involved in response to NO